MIKIKDLTFRYKESETPLFYNASLSISEGLWLLDGENGSGKTTLLKLVNSTLDERNILGVLDEKSSIITRGIIVFLDNAIELPLQLNEKTFADYILGINSIIPDEPYKPLYEKKSLLQYSTGEQKMVVFRILSYLQPNVILLDEYISNLDEEHVHETITLLEKMADTGMSIVCSSNELDIKKRFKNKIKIVERKLVIDAE